MSHAFLTIWFVIHKALFLCKFNKLLAGLNKAYIIYDFFFKWEKCSEFKGHSNNDWATTHLSCCRHIHTCNISWLQHTGELTEKTLVDKAIGQTPFYSRPGMGSSVWSCKHFSSWISLSDCSLVKGPCLAPPVPSVQLSEAARPGSSQSHVHQTIPTPTYLVKGDLHLFPAVLGTFWWEGGHHPSGALSVPCGCGLWHFGVVCFIGASLLILLPWAWGGSSFQSDLVFTLTAKRDSWAFLGYVQGYGGSD